MKVKKYLKIYYLEGTLEEIVAEIKKEVKENVPEDQRDGLKFQLAYREEYGNISLFLEALYEREETEKEKNDRLQRENVYKELEIKKLQELKAKYPDI